MRIAIISWSGGTNDPFTYFSDCLRRQIEALGHAVHLVPFDEAMGHALHALHSTAPIHLAFTWMGLGSSLCPAGMTKTLWELLDIPLVCIHGDHPCYAPPNHQRTSRHAIHLYPCRSFAEAADRLIGGDWPALVEPLPNFFTPPEAAGTFTGDFFVFPKNLQHIEDLRASWRQRFNGPFLALLLDAAEAIGKAFHQGRLFDHHEVLLDAFPAEIGAAVRGHRSDHALRQILVALGAELDRVYRNTAAAFVLDTLPDVPIRVFGSGWERHAARGNPRHEFCPGQPLSDGRAQFDSAFGIIDVAPIFDLIHDRTFRAMRHGAGLLSCSGWRVGEPIREEFNALFFSGDAVGLQARVAEVLRNPSAHRQRVADFSRAYDGVFPFRDYFARALQHAEQRGFALPR